MSIEFDEPLEHKLAPNHYVDISNKGAYSGVSSQPQRILLVYKEQSSGPRNSNNPPQEAPTAPAIKEPEKKKGGKDDKPSS